MNAGKLNRRVTFKSPSTTQDLAGQPVVGWTEFATVWADVRYLNGTEAIRAGAESATAKASIRIRYRTDITTGMRAEMGVTVFNILAVLPDEQRRERVDIVAEVIA